MEYTIVHHFPGGTKEQYEASFAAVHPSKDTLPKGQIFHALAPGLVAGRWWQSTNPRKAGSSSATAP
jgi:hypothetical protein